MIRILLLVAAALLAGGFALQPAAGLELEVAGTIRGAVDVRQPLFDQAFEYDQEIVLRGSWVQDRAGTVFLGLQSDALSDIELTLDGHLPRRGAFEPGGLLLGALDLESGLHALELRATVSGELPELRLLVGEELPDLQPIERDRVRQPRRVGTGEGPGQPRPAANLRLSRQAWLLAALCLLVALWLTIHMALDERGAYLVALTLGLAVALIGLEGALRLSGRRALPRIPGSVLVDYDFGPGRVVAYRGVHPMNVQDFTTTVRWNAEGWRDDAFGIHDQPLRVALLGDSFVAGHEVELGETFHRLLEDRWTDVEFLALGRGGTGPVQQLETLRSTAADLEPDGVLWMVFLGNDVADSSPQLAVVRRAWLERVYYGEIVPLRVQTLGLARRSGSRLVQVLADRILGLVEGNLHRLRPGLSREDLLSPAADVFCTPELAREPHWEDAWVAMEGALREGARWCEERELPLVLVSAPLADWPVPGMREEELDRDYPARRLRTFCEAEEIDLIELDTWFSEEGGADLQHPHDGHWNPRGHAVAAEALERELTPRGWPRALRR